MLFDNCTHLPCFMSLVVMIIIGRAVFFYRSKPKVFIRPFAAVHFCFCFYRNLFALCANCFWTSWSFEKREEENLQIVKYNLHVVYLFNFDKNTIIHI